MDPNAQNNRDLIKQYPFLSEILSARMEPFDGSHDTSIDDLTIKIKKADEDLMFRRADNVGLGDSSGILQMKDSRKDQVMRRGEYIFAVDADNSVINRVDWPRNDEERRKKGEIYAWAALWGTKHGNKHYSNPIWDRAKFLVWVTVEAWHAKDRNDNAPDFGFGEFRDRSIHITIYGSPEQGFGNLQEKSNVYENLSLDTQLMTHGIIDKDYDIVSMSGMLYEMCITFQDEVYFNGMKDVLDNGEFRGASGQFGAVKVLCAKMCGYDRVMLEDAASYITFQLRPDSNHMYVLGQQGTLPQIRNLVRTVVRIWNQKTESRITFKPDKNIWVM